MVHSFAQSHYCPEVLLFPSQYLSEGLKNRLYLVDSMVTMVLMVINFHECIQKICPHRCLD